VRRSEGRRASEMLRGQDLDPMLLWSKVLLQPSSPQLYALLSWFPIWLTSFYNSCPIPVSDSSSFRSASRVFASQSEAP
jgi:hypothetical protein